MHSSEKGATPVSPRLVCRVVRRLPCVCVIVTSHVVYAHVTPPLGSLLGCRGGRPRLTAPFSPELVGGTGATNLRVFCVNAYSSRHRRLAKAAALLESCCSRRGAQAPPPGRLERVLRARRRVLVVGSGRQRGGGARVPPSLFPPDSVALASRWREMTMRAISTCRSRRCARIRSIAHNGQGYPSCFRGHH